MAGVSGGRAEAAEMDNVCGCVMSRTPMNRDFALLSGSAGDVDCDGVVSFYDFGLFGGDWGYGGESASVGRGPPYRSDLDRDGVVGLEDLLEYAEAWLVGFLRGNGNVQ